MAARRKVWYTDMSAVQLLEHLDECYPAICIGENETPESAHRYAGKRELIDTLLNKLKFENKVTNRKD